VYTVIGLHLKPGPKEVLSLLFPQDNNNNKYTNFFIIIFNLPLIYLLQTTL